MTDLRQRELGILLFVANRALEQRAFDAVVAAGITDITLAQARIAARIGPDGSRVSELADRLRLEPKDLTGQVDGSPTRAYGGTKSVKVTANKLSGSAFMSLKAPLLPAPEACRVVLPVPGRVRPGRGCSY